MKSKILTKLKKFSGILAMLTLISTSICPTFAENNTQSSILLETSDCSEAKEDFFKDLECIMGLVLMNLKRDNFDIMNASIGEPFLIENSNIYIFPVLVNGNVKRMIQMTKNPDGENYYAVGDFFAEELVNLAPDTYKIVANDDFDIFAISNNNYILVEQNSEEEILDTPIMSFSNEVKETVSLNKSIIDFSIMSLASDPDIDADGDGKWLSVPIIKQTKNGCWAACMSSIMQYHGDNTSVSQILSYTGKTDEKADSVEVKNYFTHYGYSSTMFNQNSLTFSNIVTEINNKRPIWQAVGSGTSGHAVVIEGYQKIGSGTYNAITIMDPYKGKTYDCNYYSNHFSFNTYESHEGLYKIQ